MEIDELVPPEDSMLLKISGNTATYIDDMDDIESVLSLQPEKLELKNLKWFWISVLLLVKIWKMIVRNRTFYEMVVKLPILCEIIIF